MAQRFVIIGDGIAGATAAETLRANDADASITIITNEGEPLYNRVQIKDFAKGQKEEAKCRIHDTKWYESRKIDLQLFTQVTLVDDKHNTVICEDGRRYDYDKLLVATGGLPRPYPVPNGQAEGVFTFWTFADARRIRAAAEASEKAVAIGAGLLGIDLAVIFAKHDVETKYIMRGNRWWREGLNKEGSAIVEGYLKEIGVECIFGETPTHFEVTDKDHVSAVVTDKGVTYPVQAVGAAIGLNMNLRAVAPSQIKTGEGILANEFLQTSVPNVYTAGDIAQYFDPILHRVNINGSWASGKKQGEVAALNMLRGNTVPFEHVDFYSIDHFEKPVMSVGNILGDEIVEAVVAEGIYRRVIFKDNKIIGMVFVGDAKPLPFVKKIIAARLDVSKMKQDFLKADFDFKGLAASLKAPAA
ncbi:MAG TPA: FAD-dependent oxidoreductase [Candidatus Thermoplasmatota archaeon]|nr:FAD-dependent oxidoreductase [Candidatus Thermoplasmatota archaeon]